MRRRCYGLQNVYAYRSGGLARNFHAMAKEVLGVKAPAINYYGK